MTTADPHDVWRYLTSLAGVRRFSCSTESEAFTVTLTMREGFAFADAEASIRSHFPALAAAGLLKITEGEVQP